MIKAKYKTIELNQAYEYISSSYHKKYKNKVWITSHFKQGDNYYNAMVLINDNNNISIEYIFGNINGIEYDIILNEQEQHNIKRITLEYAKVNNYIKS